MSPERAVAIREGLGFTLGHMAAILRVSPRTLMRWEGHSQATEIPGPAQVLYEMMERDELPAERYAPPGTVLEEEEVQPTSMGEMHLLAEAQSAR